MFVSKSSVFLTVLVISMDDQLVFRSGLLELTDFGIALPGSFMDFTSLLELVPAFTVLFVIF